MANDFGVNHFMQKIALEISDKLHRIKTSGIPPQGWPTPPQKWYHMKNGSEFNISSCVY